MESVARMIREVFEAVRPNSAGALADYIPELGVVDPESFGIAVATIDGFCHEVGDSRSPFTIQSVSKAFTYAMALDAVGKPGVEEKVGLELTVPAIYAKILRNILVINLDRLRRDGQARTRDRV